MEAEEQRETGKVCDSSHDLRQVDGHEEGRSQLQTNINTGRVKLSRVWTKGEVPKPSQLDDEDLLKPTIGLAPLCLPAMTHTRPSRFSPLFQVLLSMQTEEQKAG